MTQGKKAIVLLSGGLDSSTLLALAIDQGYDCYTISFDYGQRHNAELTASTKIAELFGVNKHRVIKLGLNKLGGSALTDTSISVPESRTEGIPITYVPARNTIFLSYALAWSEVIKAHHIFIGVNAVDYSGYPDCRPEYINAFQEMAKLATKAGVEGQAVEIHTPLINLSKTDIIRTGTRLGVDYSQTVSCYQADHKGRACGKCDSCFYRKEGFREAGIPDPTIYRD
jgi:7-cyano-7-deazaguanine synthase